MARHIPEVSASQRFRDMTRAEQSASIADAGARVDALNPKELVSKVERLDDLRKIEAIVDGMAGLEQRLAIAVRRAKEAGRSWSEIARVLGVTKQSAHAKYVDWKLDPASLTPDSVISRRLRRRWCPAGSGPDRQQGRRGRRHRPPRRQSSGLHRKLAGRPRRGRPPDAEVRTPAGRTPRHNSAPAEAPSPTARSWRSRCAPSERPETACRVRRSRRLRAPSLGRRWRTRRAP